MADATRQVITPLLPIGGLRRDLSGNLTDDAIKTVMEGLTSLGIILTNDDATDAILHEAKDALCKLNSQYEFLLTMVSSSISRSETVEPDLFDKLIKTNQKMQDILSVSRYVLTKPSEADEPVEGFINSTDRLASIREAFKDASNTVQCRSDALADGNIVELKQHRLEITDNKNQYANYLMSLYGFLNVVTVGFIVYVISN
jgi:hypothetical protein